MCSSIRSVGHVARIVHRAMAVVLIGCLVAAGRAADPTSSPLPAQRPNIVFILADDLGYGDVACYGRPDVHTPAIDRIAARGVRFTRAYANSAVCSASRTALITGRYQYRLRVGLEEPISSVDVGLPPEHPTLPSLLKKTGYRTTLIGKWHLGRLPKYGPLQSGYDQFYGFRSGASDYFIHGSASGDFWVDDRRIDQEGYLTDLFGQRAVETIDGYAKTREPFLISLHFNAPHWPWEGPGDVAESKRLHQPGASLMDFDGGSQKTYVEMIEAMDRQIDRVLQALERNGLTQNTIVIFTSDNGGERFAYMWPFTGRKTELLEGGLSVPAIISWPARIQPGRTSNQVMIHMDWLPTLLAAAGTAPDPAFPSDGMNLLPHLLQGAPTVSRQLFWRYKANAQQAVRDGDFKYVKLLENTFLFNVVDDPMERANLKDREKVTYRRLARAWFDWNKTMLPLLDESYTHSFDGKNLADHIGTKAAAQKAEVPRPPDDVDK